MIDIAMEAIGFFCVMPSPNWATVALKTGNQMCRFKYLAWQLVIATRFIPLLPLTIVLIMVMWESSQRLGKNIVQSSYQLFTTQS